MMLLPLILQAPPLPLRQAKAIGANRLVPSCETLSKRALTSLLLSCEASADGIDEIVSHRKDPLVATLLH